LVIVEGFDGGFQPRVLRGRLSRAAATARRSFYVIDITEILVHWYAGRLQHELAASLGVDRKTIRKYVAPALAAGIAPGGPARSQEQWAGLVRDWFPELVDTRLRQVTWPGIEVHRDYVSAQLQAGVTAATIHQRLRDEHGLDASVASFRRGVRANEPARGDPPGAGAGAGRDPAAGARGAGDDLVPPVTRRRGGRVARRHPRERQGCLHPSIRLSSSRLR